MTEGMLEIRLTGLRDLQGRFARVTAGLSAVRREGLRELGREVVDALQTEAPVRTGRLRAGIGYKTVADGAEMRLRVTSAAEYTSLVIEGRGPVEAKHAKALRFEPGPPGSGYIFRRRVGPSKPNPFNTRAFARLGGAEVRAVQRMSARIMTMWERA